MVMKAVTPSDITVPAGEFKAKCLKLMDDAGETQRPITITKRGKIVGQFVPASPAPRPFRSVFGRTPGVGLPIEAEWKKLKAELADEWEKSLERTARQVNGDFSEDQ
jgi:prevent-host-death family protein